MIKLVMFISICSMLFMACSSKVTDLTEENLEVKYFLTDSLDIKRNTFHINDNVWLNFSIKNVSGNDIEYHKVSYIDELVAYSISLEDEFAEIDLQFMPPEEFIILCIQNTDEIVESKDILPQNEAGYYSMSICPYVMYNIDEFNLSSRFRIDYQITEELK